VDSSIVNIPFNLFQEVANIPNSEINAVTYAAESLFNSGPWFVVSNTNLWGVDPGDPSHFMSVANSLVPFEGLSGINAPETDFDGGLGSNCVGWSPPRYPQAPAATPSIICRCHRRARSPASVASTNRRHFATAPTVLSVLAEMSNKLDVYSCLRMVLIRVSRVTECRGQILHKLDILRNPYCKFSSC
jgi:hypothetical protein